MADFDRLSEAERRALELLCKNAGSILISRVPDKNGRSVFGEIESGMTVYRKLDQKGLVVITVEEPDETGFSYTPMIELTSEGQSALAQREPTHIRS